MIVTLIISMSIFIISMVLIFNSFKIFIFFNTGHEMMKRIETVLEYFALVSFMISFVISVMIGFIGIGID